MSIRLRDIYIYIYIYIYLTMLRGKPGDGICAFGSLFDRICAVESLLGRTARKLGSRTPLPPVKSWAQERASREIMFSSWDEEEIFPQNHGSGIVLFHTKSETH